MNIAEIFIRRPVATTLVMLAILLFGVFGYRLLPVSDLPNVDFPTVSVNASLPGASPETMASAVATPLERQFSTIAGLDSMTSTNALGVSQITLQFNLSRSIDAAAQDVQSAIAKTGPQLPRDMPSLPAYQKVNPADQPVIWMVMSSRTLKLSVVDEYAQTFVAHRISMVGGGAPVEVVDAIRKLIPSFHEQMPASVNLNILFDRSESIRDSVNDVKFTLMLTVCLVVLVIFLFLRNLSATLIPSMALPMSIVGTFAIMYLLGYSVDNLSLMALTLSVGFVVDDAIVMLENIVRHMEMGEGVLQAALGGSKEISFTILSMTLSLAAVFIPVLFMGGILGRLVHEFAVTIGVAILVSGFVSLSLTPMLASRFLRRDHGKKHGR